MQLELSLINQRHNKGRVFYQPTREYFDPKNFTVDQIPNEKCAKRFVIEHHYSRSFPAAIASFGLFENNNTNGAKLVGVCVFSVSMGNSKALEALLHANERICELGRFVLLDEIGTNAETWFLAQSRRKLAQVKRTPPTNQSSSRPVYPVISAFSDPVPRIAQNGTVTLPGHIGKIYHGQNDGGAGTGMGIYTGRSAKKTMWLTTSGTTLVDRTLNKLRNGEVGDKHVYDMLRSHGASPRTTLESGKDYVSRVLQQGPFRRMFHKGNHRYIFLAGSHSRKAELQALIGPGMPYPRHTDPI